ncbi:glycosyltransferase family 4 protein [Niveibacterium sp. 24ML]|uniref:glycosyltransferase family 4 protein n=1 Tax=Niveibacterium sp. 24ML TaxID=2985512 RepID=UPI0022719989|nr:glycosyltransferase family 4 protein [Niveibacterium sp. 24ML]MCX9158352.1 glycosyltransferase family 4 protein [Niveibacterium sp. 24ML]
MNISIVAPSSVPYVHGGAENLWLGLQRYLIENTTHHCELFKIPSPEGSVEDIVSSYRKFYNFNVDHFDRVISTKYPAWMVNHRDHVVYLQHTLRGLYDTYHFSGKPLTLPDEPLVSEVVRWMTQVENGSIALEKFFDLLQKALSREDATALREFPGAFSREVVRFLDRRGMRQDNIKGYFAISSTVRKREGYFPPGAVVGVIPHPPALSGYYCKEYDYLFTTSRLDGPKRVGLIIEAMRHVKANIRLLIGGKGPDEARLKALAGDDRRIEFLGYLNDADLLDHYANALAVPFVPYDEDYGLITIEAMMSGKPVITTTDSGGVGQFVVNHETGLAVPPDPIALAQAIDYVCSHRAEARRMGEGARRRVSSITWERVADALIGESLKGARRALLPAASSSVAQSGLAGSGRRKIVVAITFPVYPPRGGGQSRVFNLYREWARYYDVTLVTLTGHEAPAFEGEIAPGLLEIRVPKSVAHQDAENRYSASVDWVPVTDIVASTLIHMTPAYLEKLGNVCAGADIVVACHPYFVKELRAASPQAELWFEAQDVELTIKRSILPKRPASDALLEMVRNNEAEAWSAASVVFVCAQPDLKELERIYGPSAAKQVVVPNGFAADEVVFTPPALRQRTKAQLGLEGRPTVVFMGSWHGPNLEAAERVIAYAEHLSAVTFLIIGSACSAFENRVVPENVRFLGVLDEQEKQVALSAADLAVNPMTAGSGSNLKMFDYMAAGVPVLTTRFGVRGIAATSSLHYLEADVDRFVPMITAFFVESSLDDIQELARSASNLVRSKYSWESISRCFMNDLDRLAVSN